MTVNGLSAKQEQALQALMHETTVAAAAATAGISERTLYRWLSEPRWSRTWRRSARASSTDEQRTR
jgi:transposase-like protein